MDLLGHKIQWPGCLAQGCDSSSRDAVWLDSFIARNIALVRIESKRITYHKPNNRHKIAVALSSDKRLNKQ